MDRPRIVGETRRDLEEHSPPPRERTRGHWWATKKTRDLVEAMGERDAYPLYLSRRAEERIRNHALSKMEERLEVMGFLLGDAFLHRGAPYAVVRDIATTDLDASSVGVRFEREGFERLFESMDAAGRDLLVLGWYHSHPGHGCFMSETDVETQQGLFPEPYHAAIVVDPIQTEWEAYALAGDEVAPIPFVVYWEPYEDPYGSLEKVRRPRP